MFVGLLAAALISCGDKSDVKDNADKDASITAAADEEEIPERYRIKENLPEIKFDGYEFKVFVEEYGTPDIEADEEIGEIFHDTIYRRNRIIEDRYGVEFKTISEIQTSYAAKIKNEILSGNAFYDLALCHGRDAANLSLGNLWADWKLFTYIDMEKPWWDQELIRSLSIGEKVFLMSGDFNNYSFKMTSALVFNKNMMTSFGMSYPYELVREGKWTSAAFQGYLKDVTRDLNGDGVIEWATDQYGFVSWEADSPYSFSFGFGSKIVVKDEQNMPVLSMDIPLHIKIVEELYEIFTVNQSFVCTGAMGWGKDYEVFTDGRALFLDIKLDQIVTMLKAMTDDFGIVPIPKLDESQKDYLSFVNCHSTLMCLPVTNGEYDRTGIILEALAAESYRKVTPAYYDVVLQIKTTRDEESADMLDYVTRNRIWDMGYVYDIGGLTGYSNQLILSKSTNFASYYEKNESAAVKRLEKMISEFTKD
ncbi:MAG: hypothetical protein FWD23_09960 [Oscillospiraceae bacterium]|nr:hypothetical protein [Oscillospiraceae bacterium]